MTHLQIKKLEIIAVIKYSCKKGIPPKEIHEDFMEALWKESPSYSTVKKRAAEFKRESVEDDRWFRRPKVPWLMKMSRSCTPWLCVIGGKTYEV